MAVLARRDHEVPRPDGRLRARHGPHARAGPGARRRLSPLRVLCTFAGGTGHLLPLVPLARAAAAAGHTVAFACQPAMLERVRELGFAGFDTGGATLRAGGARTALLEPDPEHEARVVRETYAGRIARERAAHVAACCREWKPDALVSDELDFGAMVAAERLRLPHATLNCIAVDGFAPDELVGDPLAALCAEHGVEPDLDLRRRLVLSPFPPSLRDPGPPPAAALRTADPAPARRRARPLVYVTLGTIFNLESGDLFERLLAGVRDLPVDVVATVGHELDPAAVGTQPPNVRVERYVPQETLLPACDLVVSHGGSGSVAGALAHGLPMVLAPLGADQPLTAARCVELGVARALDPVRARPADVRDAVEDVLAGSGYLTAAMRIRDEIAALPGPEHGVALLAELVRAGSRPPG